MTKEEYLLRISENLTTLTNDEKKEALEYYENYFNDGGFDEEYVIKNLGTPEEVAESIKKELSDTLIKQEKNNSQEEKKGSDENALYYEFDKNEVRNLYLNFGAVEVICISGERFCVETRGISQESLICNLDQNGTLIIKNKNHFQNFNFFSHTRKSGFAPRILLTIPEKSGLEDFSLYIGAGRFETHRLDFACKKGKIEVGAGNCVVDGLYGSEVKIKCGMGNIKITGKLFGKTYVDCGMGSVFLDLKGNRDDYSIDSKVGLGSVTINDEKNEGINKSYTQNVRENHFSVNCGMGSVKININ